MLTILLSIAGTLIVTTMLLPLLIVVVVKRNWDWKDIGQMYIMIFTEKE